MPFRYEINVGRIHTLDDGTDIWKIDYKEYHDKETYFKVKPGSDETFTKLGFKLKWGDEDFSASYTIQGPEEQITTMLAAEFLGRSPLGTKCFNDLMASMVEKLSELGAKVGPDTPDEEPQ